MSAALVIQHAKRMCCFILSSVACLVVTLLSTLSHKRHDFRKNVIEHTICILIFCTTFSGIMLILRRIQRDIIINVQSASCKIHTRYFSNFNQTWIFSTGFPKTPQTSNFVQINPVRAELFHADIQAIHDKPIAIVLRRLKGDMTTSLFYNIFRAYSCCEISYQYWKYLYKYNFLLWV
jgi:hypothetical protein